MAQGPIFFERGEKRRQCKFIPEWTVRSDFSSWLLPVEEDPHKAYCAFCKKVFPVSHGGLHDVRAHAKGKRHLHLDQEHSYKNSNQFVNSDISENYIKSSFFDSSNSIDISVNTPLPHSVDNMNISMESHQDLYCLRWKYHHSNLQSMFSQLLERESFCDVTLSCEGRHIRAHKLMLSACSTYFDSILSQHDENNPIVVFKDVKYQDLKALVQFMYKGEIKIEQSQLTSLIKTAEELRIKGLAQVSWRNREQQHHAETILDDDEVDDEEEISMPPTKKPRSDPISLNNNIFNYNRQMMNPRLNFNQIPPLHAILSNRQQQMSEIYKYQSMMRHPFPSMMNPYNKNIMNNNEVKIDNDDDGIEILNNNNETTKDHEPPTRNDIINDNIERDSGETIENDNRSEQKYDGEEIDDEDDDFPIMLQPETVYDDHNEDEEDDRDITEERNIFSDDEEHDDEKDDEIRKEDEKEELEGKDENGNEFEMPSLPAHLTNSAFSMLNNPEEAEQITTENPEEKIDYSKYAYVVKMNDFIDQGGRRPQFWEEPSTKKVMEAIKNKELEMKVAAEIMGVSYGTLYGRYRDAYGCLKHPYRIKEFWSDQGPAEVLSKLQRRELSLYRAAELLNVTGTTLANYLATLKKGDDDYIDADDFDIENDSVSQKVPQILPDIPVQAQKVMLTHPTLSTVTKEISENNDTLNGN